MSTYAPDATQACGPWASCTASRRIPSESALPTFWWTRLKSWQRYLPESPIDVLEQALSKYKGHAKSAKLRYTLADEYKRLPTRMNPDRSGPAHGFTAKELRKLRSLKDPHGIQKFLDDAPYHLADTACSPRRVLAEKTAHCLHCAIFA